MGVGEFFQSIEALLIVLHDGRGQADMHPRLFQRQDRSHGPFPRTGQRSDAVVDDGIHAVKRDVDELRIDLFQ